MLEAVKVTADQFLNMDNLQGVTSNAQAHRITSLLDDPVRLDLKALEQNNGPAICSSSMNQGS